MEWFQAVVLGVLQGLTEFLPISSSAHLRIYPQLFGWQDPGAAFTAVTQIGTETAVILYFIKDIGRIINAWTRSLFGGGTGSARMSASAPGSVSAGKHRRLNYDPAEARLGWFVILGTVPIVVAGIALKDVIEGDFRSLWIIGTTLIVLGIVLGIADSVGSKNRSVGDLRLRDALLVGLAQALALVPGVSRSGASISMGLLLGLDRPTAARFAFLLAIPAVLGAGIYEWPSAMSEGSVYGMGPTLVATVVSFVVGYSVIAWLFRWLNRGSFAPFVTYRILLGALTLILLTTGTLAPFA
ncbi:undecaprenyl-diphosphate phosphatase [Phytoactinopolyspora alkaliphila]|uniref:Undecaprenyl-diphosphatase n=1 Tax=Phytoactinopolyspora alkaliphila TaxID=1783498 RepID=A0A6N9YRH4_9ACTN|nr:undecaprenyl-diphosphate phosphatase [Phytoactinopolyspora alkaliphila]NED97582.1 undecaprenyl-diphosphate phosphatase [Phytoactinopolyspora alkaliphila]